VGHGEVQQYSDLPPWKNVINLIAMVIYCHFMVITVAIMFHNIEYWSNHGIAVNYHGKKLF
jgi:hypothetical protein